MMNFCTTVEFEETVNHTLNNKEQVKTVSDDRSEIQFACDLRFGYFRDSITPDNATSLNVENFMIAGLLATDSNDENEHIMEAKNQMQQIVNKVQLFSNVNSFIASMKSMEQEKIFLIVSANLLDVKLISSIQNMSCVHAIYVLDENKKNHELYWLEDYRKVKGVFNDVSSVCKQIAMDVHKSEHDLIGLNIIELPAALPLKINNKQDGSFMCAQLFKDLILQTEDHNREDIAMFARPRFSDNPHQLAIISEFEHQYDPSEVIAWYTRNTFLYRMVNKALRTQDHLTIYALRLFIRDLHLKLALLQAENKPMGDKLTLYRGQALSKREFEKLKSNNGGLLSINTFLSTSEDKDIALLFTGGTLENPNIEAILFEICLNPQEVSNVTYANIDQFSVFQGTEKEYLFSMGTVFRIESVDKISGSDVWCVRLTLTTDIDVQLKSLTLHMKQELQTCDTILLKFVRLMQQMGFQATALQFYLKRYDIRNGAVFEDNGVISYLIGGICLEGQNYEGALHWFQRTLNLMNKQLSGEPLFLCTLYNSIGIAHSSTGNLDLAFEFHQRALELALSLPETSKCTIANSYLHQGEIFAEQDKLDEALILYEKALSLQIVHFPTTHPSIAYTYTCLASLYMKQRKVEQALETYNKSLSLIVASRASNHASIYTTHESISRLLWILSRNEEALQHGLEAMDIYVDAFGLDHPDTQKRQDWVDFLQREISDYNSWYEQQSHEREFQENESD